MTQTPITLQMKDALAHGKQLCAVGQYESAENLFRQITVQLPNHRAGWLALGQVLLEQFKAEESIEALERALRIQAATGELHHALGAAKALLGRLREAEVHYVAALALEPRRAEYYFHYSRLRKFTIADGTHHRIEQLLSQDSLAPSEKCHLHFAAGKIYDDMGKYDQAFMHFKRGNDCKRVRYDRQHWQGLVDSSMEVFDRSQLRRIKASSPATSVAAPTIVFIVGLPRSGTTLVEQILASHSRVFGAGELPDLNLISSKLAELDQIHEGFPRVIKRVGRDTLTGLGNFYLHRIVSMGTAATTVFCDKSPSNYFFIGLMHGLFSNVRVIHCRRYALDTALSCYATNFKQGQEFSYSLDDIAHYFGCYHRLMQHWEEAAMLPILHVDYEQLVADQEVSSRRMLEFIGLNWQDDCLSFQRTRRVVATASNWQVRQPMYRSSINRWQHYAKHLEPLRQKLGHQGLIDWVSHRHDPANAAIRAPHENTRTVKR